MPQQWKPEPCKENTDAPDRYDLRYLSNTNFPEHLNIHFAEVPARRGFRATCHFNEKW
jgi:hypothetical protein